MQHKPFVLIVALTGALLAFPAIAQAAFAPRVSVSVDPATPAARPAIDATVFETASLLNDAHGFPGWREPLKSAWPSVPSEHGLRRNQKG